MHSPHLRNEKEKKKRIFKMTGYTIEKNTNDSFGSPLPVLNTVSGGRQFFPYTSEMNASVVTPTSAGTEKYKKKN